MAELGLQPEEDRHSQGRSKTKKRSKSTSRSSSLDDNEISFKSHRSSSRESGEVSGLDSDMDADMEIEQEIVEKEEKKNKANRENPKDSRKDDRKRKHSLEETFEKMQWIISKKGFLDADAMSKLTKKLDSDDCNRQNTTPVKRHVGGGDKEERRNSNKFAKWGKVKFGNPIQSTLSLSEITIYDQAVQMKSNLKRPSISSEEEMELVDLSDEMEYLEHNSHNA